MKKHKKYIVYLIFVKINLKFGILDLNLLFSLAKPVSSSLLPSHDVCGVDTQDRIYGGEEAELSEFPWMALIEYQRGRLICKQ